MDTVSYASANHSVLVDLNREGGYARAQTGSQPVTHLVWIENVIGAPKSLNYLHGNAADNVFTGGDLSDWFTRPRRQQHARWTRRP